jgi:hypothetical protein
MLQSNAEAEGARVTGVPGACGVCWRESGAVTAFVDVSSRGGRDLGILGLWESEKTGGVTLLSAWTVVRGVYCVLPVAMEFCTRPWASV